MEILVSMFLGYLLGSLSPAALISRMKKKNLREHGTGNLGATNTMLTFGKRFGVFVMLFDVLKGALAVHLARRLFPLAAMAGLVAGSASVAGHMFPFYMKGKGGKGLAAFGGMVLAYDPMQFLFLLTVGVTLMLVTNHSVVLPLSASLLFTGITVYQTRSMAVFVLLVSVFWLLVYRHWDNIMMVKNGNDADIRGYIREHF